MDMGITNLLSEPATSLTMWGHTSPTNPMIPTKDTIPAVITAMSVRARGLVQESKILLLDEPTSNLDIRHQLDVTRMLKDLTMRKDILTIMISHDISITAKFADEIILMHDGRIFDVGTPGKVITEENLSTVYGVKTRIIDDDGRPHVILKDAIPIDENASPGDSCVVTSRSEGAAAVPE